MSADPTWRPNEGDVVVCVTEGEYEWADGCDGVVLGEHASMIDTWWVEVTHPDGRSEVLALMLDEMEATS